MSGACNYAITTPLKCAFGIVTQMEHHNVQHMAKISKRKAQPAPVASTSRKSLPPSPQPPPPSGQPAPPQNPPSDTDPNFGLATPPRKRKALGLDPASNMADLDLVAPVSAIGKLPSGVFDYAILLLMLFFYFWPFRTL